MKQRVGERQNYFAEREKASENWRERGKWREDEISRYRGEVLEKLAEC